jgi:hypothetical protein
MQPLLDRHFPQFSRAPRMLRLLARVTADKALVLPADTTTLGTPVMLKFEPTRRTDLALQPEARVKVSRREADVESLTCDRMEHALAPTAQPAADKVLPNLQNVPRTVKLDPNRATARSETDVPHATWLSTDMLCFPIIRSRRLREDAQWTAPTSEKLPVICTCPKRLTAELTNAKRRHEAGLPNEHASKDDTVAPNRAAFRKLKVELTTA